MVEVLIKSDPRYEVNRKALREAIIKTLTEQGITGGVEVSVAVVGDRKMRLLNKQFRRVDETTDVLSFPYEAGSGSVKFVRPAGPTQLGDVVISYPQAVLQAAHDNILVDEEIAKIARHGAMHLLGFDHDEFGRWYFR